MGVGVVYAGRNAGEIARLGGGRAICDEEFRGGAQDLLGCVDGS
jgi:hypothetical protein